MRSLPVSVIALLIGVGAGLAAVEPAPTGEAPVATAVPLGHMPPEVCVLLRLGDGGRRTQRWAASPFPLLFATAWGKNVAEQVRTQPGPFQLLAQLAPAQQVTIGIVAKHEQPVGHVLARMREATTATALVATLAARPAAAVGEKLEVRATLPLAEARLEGFFRPRAPGLTNGIRWSWGELLPLPATAVGTPIDPLVDLDIQWQTAAPWTEVPGSAPFGVHGEWQVTPAGVREVLHLTGIPDPRADEGPRSAVERTAFEGLPADTIWALSSARLPTVIEQIPGLSSTTLETWMQQQGLPPWATVKPQLGTALLWLQQGAPLPALTIDIRMPRELATAALAWLDAKHQFSPSGDGSHLGAVGFIPVQAAWREGSLVITTSSAGMAGATARPGGFTVLPVITEALKALPEGDLLLAGVSRSGESWASLAAVAPWLMRRKPELASLATDLRRGGRFGFFSLRREPGELTIDAGGLFGGPLATTAILGGFFHAVTGDRGPERPAGNERQRRRDDQRQEAPPLVPPPKQVEF
jgi:hypothetical protein